MTNELELLHPDLPELVDNLLRLRGWSWEQAAAGEAVHAGKKFDLQSIQEVLIYGDPVLFAETHLIEQPDNRTEGGGICWKLFEYQKPSLRWPGNAIHQDAAEVGKTREIVALLLWMALVRGSVLVAAPLDGQLLEIWEECEFQLAGPVLKALQTKKSRVKPYRRFCLNFDADFRPCGIAGESLRGVHANAGFMDEAATIQNPRIRSEFMRAMKPRARVRWYSVPNGVLTTPYAELKKRAIPFEPIMLSMAPEEIVRSALGMARSTPPIESGLISAVQKQARDSDRRVYVKFHWPKMIMAGTPFWNEERRLTYIEDFGGADSPGYVHNVLGLDGDPSSAVFPWAVLERNLATLDGYRRVSIGIDRHDHRIDVEVRRPNPAFGPDGDIEALTLESRARLDLLQLEGENESVREAELERLFRAAFPVAPAAGLVAGVDVGSHVTAINFARVIGDDFPPTLALEARVALRGADGPWQRLVIRALDSVLSPSWGWGLDATGIGNVLLAELRSTFDSHRFDERISGFVFNQSLPEIDPKTAQQVLRPDGKPRVLMTKELGTQLLESVFGRASFLLPRDDELLHQLQSQVATIGKSGARQISKGNDHDPDSLRTLVLRLYERRCFGAAPTGPIVFHTPPEAGAATGALPQPFARGSAEGGLLEGF